ncbi:hypothetical protein [Paenibacillus sp. MMS18-CY102]|uniref:hypothetical protein n=1 Tax=Paenibacillus sp. MMS18-CY102 TaxID=2682849 RepID=UPI00136620DE|nr:hypothetical protein [Paenibacillus sp. MMS18-CY102]MWC27773.1 hypothetical protein [Paenibacillus sp. MMS18-CY102]
MKGGEAVSKQKPWNWMLFPFSAVKTDGDNVYAASPGNGIYHSSSVSDWTLISEELPPELVVNRLQLAQGKLYACTNEGLFTYEEGQWHHPGSSIPCYQYKAAGQCGWAATEYGLWHRCGGAWEKVACPDNKVYDFLNLPQFLIVGHEEGIAIYDRFVDEWSQFHLQVEVTSLAVFHGHLLGAGAGGELIVGNKRGGFDVVRFDNRIIFTLVKKAGHVYACTDKGLYRIGYLRGQITLFAVKLGFPVTDVDSDGKHLMMATLFEGIQAMPLAGEQEEES